MSQQPIFGVVDAVQRGEGGLVAAWGGVEEKLAAISHPQVSEDPG